MMRRISFEKMAKANRVVVTQCENVLVRPWWKFWKREERLRMVTRVLKDRMTGIHEILHERKLTEFESTLFEAGDMHSYTIEYPEGVGCHDC